MNIVPRLLRPFASHPARSTLALILFLLLVASFIARGPVPALREKGRASFDFGPVYGGVRAWFHGKDAYNTPIVHAEFHAAGGDDIFHPHGYFPPLMPIAALAAWAPWPTARVIWLTISILAWSATLYCVTRMVDWKPPQRFIPLIWGLACWPAVMNIKMGQPATLTCALTTWAIYFAVKDRFIAGGIALGMAVGCKPTLGVAGVYFCLVQRKFKTLFAGAATLAVVYLAVLSTALPGSLYWFNEQITNLLPEFSTVSSPLPSGPQVNDFINLQPIVALFTENLRLGNAITFLVVGCFLIAFYMKSLQAGPADENWPAAVTLSVSLGLLMVYHRYPDLFLTAAIIPACWILYTRKRSLLAAVVAGILVLLSAPLQTEFSDRLKLPPLRSHQPLEVLRVLILFHHQALFLLTLALLSFRMLVRNPAGYPAPRAAASVPVMRHLRSDASA